MDRVRILGARGSICCAGSEFTRYGGDTTCVMVQLAGETIFLDAGSGLTGFPVPPDSKKRRIRILLSHPHADHLAGLLLSPLMLDPEVHVDIYGKSREGLDVKAQIHRLVSPPIWPVCLTELPADIGFHELPERICFGAVTVETMEGCHPGGVSLIKLSAGGHSIVFVSDCTLTEELFPKLREFAQGCSLFLCDGQYSEEEWPLRSAFGHSTWHQAARLGMACGAARIRIIHHDPTHTDSILDAASRSIAVAHPDFGFAKAREEIIL